jgi:RimJ/RimL family protein N-acetyltransferase
MEILFDTPRLRIRMMAQEDAPFIVELFNSPNWLRFLGDRNVRTLEEAGAYIRDIYLKNYADNGFGAAIVTRKEDGAPIGICGLFQRAYLPGPDLGYSLLPAFEGKGYAREAAAGMLDYVGKRQGRDALSAIVSAANTRSIHLLEQLGFIYDKEIQPPGEERTVSLYHIRFV